MNKSVSTLLKYLNEIGATTSPVVPDPGTAKSLPVFVGQIYQVYRGSIFDRDYCLLFWTGGDRPTPGEVEKHAELAYSAFGPNVAFVFLTLPAFDRKRLIERRIPFIVPGRQTYLPMVLIDLREKATGGQNVPLKTIESLSAPAQLLVLFHLQKKEESGDWSLNRWVEALGYSRSTLTRVYKELTSAELCEPIGQGRHVVLKFHTKSHELWEKAMPYLQSPVAGRSRARILDSSQIQLYEAGLTALAKITLMAPPRERLYALSSAAFQAASEEHRIVQIPYPEEDTVSIERWKYAPGLLSPDGRTVDRLSLYLSLKDDPDERIQGALKDLWEQMQW